MHKPLKNAIVFFAPKTKRPRKYRNISNKVKFALFCQKQGAWYINWYNATNTKFEGREWLKNDFTENMY